jgi:hypothetical protein
MAPVEAMTTTCPSGSGADHLLGADAAARARLVLDQHGLPPGRLQMRRQDPGERVGAPARRERDDDRDRARGKGLRRRFRAGEEGMRRSRRAS